MNKYKICPVCQTKNPPSVLECAECGNDLMGVRIVDDSIHELEVAQNSSTKAAQPQTDLVRVCDCGYENEVSERKCASCGEDISDIIPSPRTQKTAHKGYVFSSIDGKATLRLDRPGEYILGREHELATYLQPKLFVSRKHAILTVTDEGVFIRNLSKANGTYLNNEKISDTMAYKLCIGDEIGLGGFTNHEGRQELAAYFVVGAE